MQAPLAYFGDENARRAWISVGAPILGLVVVIIVLAVSVFAGFARQHDRVYAESTQRLFVSALNGRSAGLATMTVDFAHWDAAVANISVAWNQSWVNDNIYSNVADAMFVFRADGTVRYAWFSESVTEWEADIQSASIQAAIAIPTLRRLARAPVPGETSAYTYAMLDGRLLAVAVAPVTPENNTRRTGEVRVVGHDYIAAVDVLEPQELAAIGVALELEKLTLAPFSGASRGVVRLPVVAANGDLAAVLQWRHTHPGSAAFLRQIWPVVLALLVIGALTLLMARHLAVRQIEALAGVKAARDASRERSEFLGRVSAELRTPLVAVIGYAELIQEEAASPAARADAQRIIGAARALSVMLCDIIDQSRIDADAISMKREVVPVAGLLAEVQGIIHPVASAVGVQVNVSHDAIAAYAYADHTRLRQCLTNIVGNAVKFSRRAGAVHLRARLTQEDGCDWIVIEVSDSGLGIAAEEIPGIFRPFGQANAAIGAVYGGAGLGLSIARALARAMGGDISAVSASGEGSCFYLRVPAATARALSAA